MCAERSETVRQVLLWDAIGSIPDLVEDAVTAFLNQDSRYEISKNNNRLEDQLPSLVNKAVDDKSRSVEFDNRLLRTVEDVTSSTQHLMSMTEAALDNQDFITVVATIIKKEAKKAIDVEKKS